MTIQGADPSMLEFLSKRPQCMTPAGAGALAALLKEFRAWGVDSAQAQAAVARCPRLLTVPAHRMRDVAAALLKFGLAPEQRAAVIKGWPQVLRMGCARPPLPARRPPLPARNLGGAPCCCRPARSPARPLAPPPAGRRASGRPWACWPPPGSSRSGWLPTRACSPTTRSPCWDPGWRTSRPTNRRSE